MIGLSRLLWIPCYTVHTTDRFTDGYLRGYNDSVHARMESNSANTVGERETPSIIVATTSQIRGTAVAGMTPKTSGSSLTCKAVNQDFRSNDLGEGIRGERGSAETWRSI